MNVRCCVTWWVKQKMKVCDDVDVVVTVTMMSLKKRKKNRESNMILMVENWILNEKKITVLMTCLFDVSMFSVNSNNEQWINNE